MSNSLLGLMMLIIAILGTGAAFAFMLKGDDIGGIIIALGTTGLMMILARIY